MRPEGFEPPAYCSVADDAAWTLGGYRCTCGESFSTYEAFKAHTASKHGVKFEWNRPCPMCGAPLVWGVCDRPHDAALVVWELAA